MSTPYTAEGRLYEFRAASCWLTPMIDPTTIPIVPFWKPASMASAVHFWVFIPKLDPTARPRVSIIKFSARRAGPVIDMWDLKVLH